MKHKIIKLFCCLALIISGFTLLVSGQSRKTLAIPSTESCAQHLTWKIGEVDPRFNIDDKTIKSLMADVGNVWSRAAGKELIAHNDSGEVAINFVYTEEQKTTDNEQQLLKRINRMKLQHLTLEQDYEQLFFEHQEKLTHYESMVQTYVKTVNKYNWSMTRKGNTGVVEKIENERLSKLKETAETLEKELEPQLKELNGEVEELQLLSTKLDEVANEVNELIFFYKNRFDSNRTFYQGIYIDDLNHRKINIYEFENIDRLRLVLAHEMGHALGLGHVDNPRSIMNYKLEHQNAQNLKFTEEDVQAIKIQCTE